jgi:hypothetical protein
MRLWEEIETVQDSDTQKSYLFWRAVVQST